MAENIILCGYLGICSCYDCRNRHIPLWLLRLGVCAGTVYACVAALTGQAAWQTLLAGAAPGVVMLLYSRLSQGKLGAADGLMVIPAGLLQHWEICTAEVLAACFMTFLAAVGLLLTGKGTRDTRIPFAPFFLAALLILWITQDCRAGVGG
ncbi:MAG TPA: prepilin peptidase [Candidatus Eisenbergiella merdipullorum]|uniref:Prepilin peptidase n=1 Tax=Candidatus Eisenbergiella merdipullorum TaxID=2838553 RepID=A0A9D2KZN5_9FIRM|nr:prepilin peptidase [Candidatus Eisenbergiella merdipullorum]